MCGSHKQHLSCPSLCNCLGDKSCCNPYTTQEDDQPENEEDPAADNFDVDMVGAEEEDFQEVDILDDDCLIPDYN